MSTVSGTKHVAHAASGDTAKSAGMGAAGRAHGLAGKAHHPAKRSRVQRNLGMLRTAVQRLPAALNVRSSPFATAGEKTDVAKERKAVSQLAQQMGAKQHVADIARTIMVEQKFKRLTKPHVVHSKAGVHAASHITTLEEMAELLLPTFAEDLAHTLDLRQVSNGSIQTTDGHHTGWRRQYWVNSIQYANRYVNATVNEKSDGDWPLGMMDAITPGGHGFEHHQKAILKSYAQTRAFDSGRRLSWRLLFCRENEIDFQNWLRYENVIQVTWIEDDAGKLRRHVTLWERELLELAIRNKYSGAAANRLEIPIHPNIRGPKETLVVTLPGRRIAQGQAGLIEAAKPVAGEATIKPLGYRLLEAAKAQRRLSGGTHSWRNSIEAASVLQAIRRASVSPERRPSSSTTRAVPEIRSPQKRRLKPVVHQAVLPAEEEGTWTQRAYAQAAIDQIRPGLRHRRTQSFIL